MLVERTDGEERAAHCRVRRKVIAVRFLMMVCGPVAPAEVPAGPAVAQWVTTMDSKGHRITGGELAPEAEVVAVQVRDGQRQVTEGAYLETKGALLGFDLLECRDLAEAIGLVATHPLASRCTLEIRPFAD